MLIQAEILLSVQQIGELMAWAESIPHLTHMKSNRDEVYLKARIKLLKRHAAEWAALMANQREVIYLAHQNISFDLSPYLSPRLVESKLKVKLASRLNKILKRQSRERKQLLERHQIEVVLLEQTIEQSLY